MKNHTLSRSPALSHQQYEYHIESNPSLLTADFPSDSKIISRNQNRATDTQPITFNSQTDDCCLTHRTLSDTYLNLTHQDIDDVITALHTLARYVNYNQKSKIENENDRLTVVYSKTATNSLRSSNRANNSSYCHHHQSKSYKTSFNHSNISSYPSYSSNAMFYTSTSCQPRSICHQSQQYPSTNHLSSKDDHQQSMKMEKVISIDRHKSHSNIQILPQQVHTLQILQTNPFDTNDLCVLNFKPISYLKTFDIATQWNSHEFESKQNQSDENINKNENLETNSTILTELSQSKTNSLAIKKSLSSINNWCEENDHLPICKCSIVNLLKTNTQSISRENDPTSSIINKKRRRSTSTKCASARSPHRTLKSSKKKNQLK